MDFDRGIGRIAMSHMSQFEPPTLRLHTFLRLENLLLCSIVKILRASGWTNPYLGGTMTHPMGTRAEIDQNFYSIKVTWKRMRVFFKFVLMAQFDGVFCLQQYDPS